MKRGTQFKILFAFALSVLLVGGISAQTPIPGYDDGAGGSNYETTAATQVTVGKTIPVYALPDAYYHPSYDPVTGNGITAGFSWIWTPPVGGEITLGGAADNYVEVTGATVGGPYVLQVQEDGPFCTGAAQSINITVLAQPTAAMSQTGTVEDCAGSAALPAAAIQTTITDNSGSDYNLVWRLEIYTMSGAIPAADEWFDATLASLGPAQDFAANYTVDAPDQATAAPGSFNMTAVVPNATINSKTTVYSYTLTSINDLVSRRGDFQIVADVNSFTWDEFAYNALVGQTLVVTVHPTPTTGPIYHIDNTWAQ